MPQSAAAICVANHHPVPGTVLRPVPCTVTPEQQAAADRLVAETRQGIAPYQDVRVALAAGYRPGAPDGSGTAHYSDFRAPSTRCRSRAFRGPTWAAR